MPEFLLWAIVDVYIIYGFIINLTIKNCELHIGVCTHVFTHVTGAMMIIIIITIYYAS